MTYQPSAYQYEISIQVLRGDANFAPRVINSYQDVDVLTAPVELNYLTVPIYDVYCIDRTTSIARSTYQDYFVFSSTEFQDSLIDTPLRYQATDNQDGVTRIFNYDNLDNINWLLNQNFYGKSTDENGNPISSNPINATDIQNAIWTLLNQQNSLYTPNANVTWLVNEAVQKGDDYLAGAGQLQGLIIAHEFNQFQPLILVTQAAQLGDTVWLDANGDGIQNNNEAGIAGVTVQLLRDLNGDGTIATAEVVATTTTGANGFYDFKGLIAGFEYQVLFDASVVGPYQGENGGFTLSQVVTLDPGEYDQTVDAGFTLLNPPPAPPATASIGNFVWNDANANGIQDQGEVGIENVTVNLLANGEIIATVATDENGFYIFEDIEVGTYQVQFFQPEGFIASPTGQGTGATDSEGLISAAVTLEGGDYNDTIDAGFYQTASLGNFVWHDLNANGIQDSGESGISGAAVNLLQDSAVIDSATTDGNGFYLFDGLLTGTYQVQFIQPNGFNGVSPTGQGTGANDSEGLISAAVTLAPGENNDSLDAGFYQTASLGNFVWRDLNANGVQDNGEAGISGATVKLLQNGGVIATATTDATGSYQFTGLTPGAGYQVQFVQPNGFNGVSPTGQGTGATDSEGLISAAVTLEGGDYNDTIDAGFYQTASLGNFVWHDLNANGIQDSGESGISGAAVNLLQDSAVIDSATTDGNGFYLFDGLLTGTYQVQFIQPNGFNGVSPTGQGTGATDSEGLLSAPVALASGETNNTLDAGFYQTASLGDRIWLDADRDGIQDNGEAGISGANVKLLQNGGVIATATTGANGSYQFTGLTPGAAYQVAFDVSQTVNGRSLALTLANQGANDALDSDALLTNGAALSQTVTLQSGENNLTVDAGFYNSGAGLTAPGSGTPGFWQQNGLPFWDGIIGNESKAGNKGFPHGELLTTSAGVLVGDFNRNGITDNGEDTLFISLANARNLVSGGGGSQVDEKLGRSVVASWLNYLAGNSVDLVGGGKDIADYLGDAVNWLQAYQSGGVGAVSAQLGNDIHTILDNYNNGSAAFATGNFRRG